ncbi:alcohol dehydrogenase catalytic domain-containing protein [Xanthomonas campestris]|uniref:alcohol dehydrogenase catalytic domain-containing protein n=1 Tax=Xanthomonas TaxID=338 RepID=UPI001E517383|nr:alcohol dehydrogenase catalytic domain-containing protein [Xanthomonas campestris]MCC5090451.1 alcohol dehydrogenase catalytic domain-containing protein [Xanthomonas campestris]
MRLNNRILASHESSMTTTIRFRQYGGPEVLAPENEQVGPPGVGQVRLRQEAIGVNFIDTAFRLGIFPRPLPGVTGVEGAGIVEEVGPGVEDISVGDRMAYFLSPGAYAEVRLVNAADLVRSPADLSSSQIATVLTKNLFTIFPDQCRLCGCAKRPIRAT